jgi:hypothetical protein
MNGPVRQHEGEQCLTLRKSWRNAGTGKVGIAIPKKEVPMKTRNSLLATGLLAFGLLGIARAGADMSLPASQVPMAVRSAVQRDYPQATVQGYKHDADEPTGSVEVDLNDNGMDRAVLYSANGDMLEQTSTVAPGKLPGLIQAAIRDHAGADANVLHAESYQRNHTRGYDIVVKRDGMKRELVLDNEGQLLRQSVVD